MPNPISVEKRDAINERLAAGEKPAAVAVGVGRTTVLRYAQKIRDSGGLAAVQALQVVNMPAARMYIEGDDKAVDDLLGLMDLKAQAQTMRTLVQARNVYAAGRSCDVAELYAILGYTFEQIKVNCPAGFDGQIRQASRTVDSHIRARYPHIVDRLSRAGIPL